MEQLAYFAPVLGCLAMAAVMVVMMRGQHHSTAPRASSDTDAEIAQLRAEIATLKAEQAIQPEQTRVEVGKSDRTHQTTSSSH